MLFKMRVFSIILVLLILGAGVFGTMTVTSANPEVVDDVMVEGNLIFAEIYTQTERYESAIEHCDAVLASDPENTRALELKTECLTELGRYTEALDSGNKFLSLRPEAATPEMLSRMGGLNLKAGEYAGALPCYDAAAKGYDEMLALSPDDISLLKEKAILLVKAQRYDEAEGCYDSIIALEPDNAYAWIGKGDTSLFRGMVEGGQIEDIHIMSDPSAAHNQERMQATDMTAAFQSHQKAMKCYQKASEIDPGLYPLVAAKIMGTYEESINSCQDILDNFE